MMIYFFFKLIEGLCIKESLGFAEHHQVFFSVSNSGQLEFLFLQHRPGLWVFQQHRGSFLSSISRWKRYSQHGLKGTANIVSQIYQAVPEAPAPLP